MLQTIESTHSVDENDNPAGGRTTGTGISIDWQDGPLSHPDGTRSEPNGAFVEGVIAAAADRLRYYQDTKFRCRENAVAITKLEEAMMWLQWRTRDREAHGVEGSHGTRPSEG